jgi:hypothetical protein
VKEHPIIFTAESVRAILEGRKTQTRRVMKPQPPSIEEVKKRTGSGFSICSATWMGHPEQFHICGPTGVALEIADLPNSYDWTCPFGVPGTKLWVRETFRLIDRKGCIIPRRDYAKGLPKEKYVVEYKSDKDYPGPWKSPIHTPRWASRITLELTEIRVQCLQEITTDDAIAEGILKEELPLDPDNFHPPGSYGYVSGLHPFPEGRIYQTPEKAFRELWDSINEKRGFGWEKKNPWVWCLTFRRL